MACSRCLRADHARQTRAVQGLLANKLQDLKRIFPGTEGFSIFQLVDDTPSLLTSAGEQIWNQPGDIEACDALYSSGLVFATAISSQDHCGVVHIRGQTHLFSLYAFGEKFLVFWTTLKEGEEPHETSSEDDQVMEWCAEVQELVSA